MFSAQNVLKELMPIFALKTTAVHSISNTDELRKICTLSVPSQSWSKLERKHRGYQLPLLVLDIETVQLQGEICIKRNIQIIDDIVFLIFVITYKFSRQTYLNFWIVHQEI